MTDGSKLALALSKAQGMMKPAKKDADNPFFKSKYADLASVWEAARDALSQNEIAVMQIPEMQGSVIGIRTVLVHSSGEREQGFFPLAVPVTAKAQEMGSAMTYLRRYALAAMVGVAPEDDDGNTANTTGGQKIALCTPEQASSLIEYGDVGIIKISALLKKYGKETVQELTVIEAQEALKVAKEREAKNGAA